MARAPPPFRTRPSRDSISAGGRDLHLPRQLGPWLNGRASALHAEGWEFESPWIHEMETLWAPAPHTGLLNRRPANGLGVRLSPFPRRVHGSTGERCDRTAEIEGSIPFGSTISGCWRVGAPLGLGPRPGRFDSCHPDEECRCSSAVERRVANAKIVGSIPITCSTCRRSTVAVR